jgi:hypothetical protein
MLTLQLVCRHPDDNRYDRKTLVDPNLYLPPFVDELNTLLDTESGTFQGRLKSLLDSSMNESDKDLAKAEVLFFMYFDEAHVLTQVAPEDPPTPRSKYHLLGRVLAKMNTLRFLSFSFQPIPGLVHSRRPHPKSHRFATGTTPSYMPPLRSFHSTRSRKIPSPFCRKRI